MRKNSFVPQWFADNDRKVPILDCAGGVWTAVQSSEDKGVHLQAVESSGTVSSLTRCSVTTEKENSQVSQEVWILGVFAIEKVTR